MTALFVLFSTSSAQAADIELSPGDDLLSKTAVLNAGDRILLGDGVYDIPSDLYWSGQGTEDNPIFIGAKDGSSHPVLRFAAGYFLVRIQEAAFIEVFGLTFEGGDNWEEGGYNAISIENSTDIKFTDNEIRFFDGYGIDIGGSSSRLTIANNNIHDIQGDGIYAGCYDASCFTTESVFANNWIHHIGTYLSEEEVEEYATGIVIAHGGQNNTVRDNVIHDVSNDGIYVGSTEFGDPNLVEANAIWAAFEDGIVIEGSATVRNNLLFDIGDDGIRCYNSDRNTLENVVISFNTVAGAEDYAVELSDWVGRSGMVLANNAIVNPIGLALSYEWSDYDGEEPDPNNVISTNVVTGYVEGWDEETHPAGVIAGGGFEDFVDATAWNFYPVQSGALVNSADPSGDTYVPEEDFNGAVRQGDVPDVGAYEFGGADNPGWAVQEGFKETGALAAGQGDALGGCCGNNGQADQAAIALPLLALFGWRRRK
jgi:hypothetical protein